MALEISLAGHAQSPGGLKRTGQRPVVQKQHLGVVCDVPLHEKERINSSTSEKGIAERDHLNGLAVEQFLAIREKNDVTINVSSNLVKKRRRSKVVT